MHAAYAPGDWQTFYAVVGGSSASLTGLLFVALSVNRRAIMNSHIQRARAQETLSTLLSLLVLSLLLLVPGQSEALLGAELVALGAVLLTAGAAVQRATLRRMTGGQRRFWLGRLVLLDAGTAGFVIAGGAFAFRVGGGLFWLLPTVLVYVLWAATNAWVLVLHDISDPP